jgi:hypothetical protein
MVAGVLAYGIGFAIASLIFLRVSGERASNGDAGSVTTHRIRS